LFTAFDFFFKLQLLDEPLEFLKPLTDVEVKESETAVLECEVSKPNMAATWSQAGKTITPSDRVEMVVDGTFHRLIIKDARIEDQAEYKIQLDDKSSQASVFVAGKPHTAVQY
jgi:titin